MKFHRSTERRAEVAAQFAGVVWMVFFAAMFVGSKVLGKNPTSRWVGVFGLLAIPIGMGSIVNSERYSIRSTRWKFIRHSPEFYVFLGTMFLLVGLVFTIASIAASTTSWFG
jgi:hypothetical protein